MGIIRTDEWLEKELNDPIRICNRLSEKFNKDDPRQVYEYLQKFGMYRPNYSSRECFEALKKKDIWEEMKSILERYRRKWKGPDIPVYIFPINERNGLFFRNGARKAGVSFKDKLFLFLTPLTDPIELEALFVHEYHHVCRMNAQKKQEEEYTLLDSIVLEGLAELAVHMECGEKYLAPWCKYYREKELSYYWDKFISPNLDVKRAEKIHDQLLFGEGRYPKLLGYAAGYDAVLKYKHTKSFSTKASFVLPSENFVKVKEK